MVDERPRATDEEMAAWEANAHKLLHEKAPKQYGPQMAILILLAEVRASRELLAKLEWAGSEYREGDIECPECRAPRDSQPTPETHTPGCALASLLGRQP